MLDEEPNYSFFMRDQNAKKRVNTKQNASDFKKLGQIEHIWVRPEPNLGSTSRAPRKESIYNFETEKFEIAEVTTPKAQCRCFLEILSNAADGIRVSRRNGVNAGNMEIIITPTVIMIQNDGLPIPVLPHPDFVNDSFGTVVDLIFGNIGAGSNLDDANERTESGANGLGAKLCNVFSSYFEVEVGDNINGVHQDAIWTGNMMNKIQSVCEPEYVKKNNTPEMVYNEVKSKEEKRDVYDRRYEWVTRGKKYSGPNFVKVTWRQDLRKFKDANDLQYNYEDLCLYMKYILGVSFSTKIKVKMSIIDFFDEDYEDVIFDYRDINKYMTLFSNDKAKNIVSYSWPKNIQLPEKRELNKKIISGEIVPTVEVALVDAPQSGFDMSFCNGIYNYKGGEHTNEGYRTFFKLFKEVMISNKSLGFVKEEIEKLTITEIKKHAILIMNYSCESPGWDSQEKEAITGPKPKIAVDRSEMSGMKDWGLIDAIYKTQSSKNKQTTKQRNKRKVDANFRDANFVGKKGVDTIAMPCEGGSAGSYMDVYIMALKGGFDIHAKINLRGKIKNVTGLNSMQMDAKLKDGSENELAKFVAIIGLEDDLDYRTKEAVDRLRYKYVRVMVDADSDGSHILCLLINFFYRRFPTFIMARRLSWVMTPVIRAVNPNNDQQTIERFYNIADYEDWQKENPRIKHRAAYFKGLAAASISQAKEDAQLSPNEVLYFDDEAEIYLDVAFSQERGASETRKQWIHAFKDHVADRILEGNEAGLNMDNFIRISNLINTKLVEYSLETLPRALVHIHDNFKHSQRQLMYYLLKTFNYGKQTKTAPKKLATIASGATDMCKYHHGDLMPVIARMGHDYAGSNNLPYVTKKGMIGSRTELGKDCGAGRYVTTDLNWWIKFLYKKELLDLIPKNVVEGDEVEYLTMPAKIPMVLANGTKGIGSGWSSSVPNHHPGDIAYFILRLISGETVFPLVPWFINFKGEITLELKKGTYVNKNKDISEEEGFQETYTGLTCKTCGIYEILREYESDVTFEVLDSETGKMKKEKKKTKCYDIEITEVPINVEPKKLFQKLSDLSLEVGQVKTTDANHPHFIFTGYHGSIQPSDLGMVSRQGLTNINMVDGDGAPVSFNNIYEVINVYCGNMDELYQLRKEKKIEKLQEDLDTLEMKLRLVKMVLAKEWVFVGISKKKIKEDLDGFQIPIEIFRSIGGEMYTQYGADELEAEFNNKSQELDKAIETSHLQEWMDDLEEFIEELEKHPEYTKLPIHEYDYVECNMEDLLEGKILAPYSLEKGKTEI